MKKLSLALLFWLGLSSIALAQTKFTMPPPAGVVVGGVQVVTTCGAASGLVAGNTAFIAMDTTGALCTNASGGGGGAATIANGADVAEGNTADAASTAGGTGTVSAKLRLMTTQLGTINTTLGSPFQAGGSIGNTTFAATQATAANLNATVVGTGTFATQATLAAETTKVIGTVNQGTSPWVISGALTANQSVNVAQIAGTTTATGSGVMGAGTQRTALATDSPGIVALGQTTKSASVPVTIASDQYVDPCQSPNIAKSSAPINITSATTTSLVAVSGSTIVYVCGLSFTVSEVITTANTILFEYGTGAACSSPVALTGKYGDGGVTAGIPIVVNASSGGTIFKSAASNGICALTTIGATGSFQGVITYVQQ
jgi:hypothetical protein